MRKTSMLLSLLLLIPALGQRTLAQNAKAPDDAKAPAHYYHMEFVLEELDADGKPVNSRSYTTTVSTDMHETMSIRCNDSVPYARGTNVWNYDVGVQIDGRDVHEVDRQLALDLTANVNSLGPSKDVSTPTSPNGTQSITRTNRWQALVLVPIGKRTVVFKSDNLDSKGAMQMVVTATPIQ